jgi:hypothetical protein
MKRKNIKVVGERGLPVEVLDQPALPGRGKIERGDQRGEQADIADPDIRPFDAVMRGRLDPEGHHLGVRRGLVRPPEGFDAGLQNFRRTVAAVAVDRPEIAKTLRRASDLRGEIVAGDGNGEVRTQAQFAALGVDGEIHVAADVLAGEVEERLGRLQDRWRNPAVAGPLIGADQRFGPSVGLRSVALKAHKRRPARVFSRVAAGL